MRKATNKYNFWIESTIWTSFNIHRLKMWRQRKKLAS
jgi:hypothetical protein